MKTMRLDCGTRPNQQPINIRRYGAGIARYCGHIGVIGPRAWNGAGVNGLALNIAIRTILYQEGCAYVFAGGGIVADSDPVQEYEETLHKAAALFHALGIEPPRLS